MSEFRWRKDGELKEECDRLSEVMYEDEVIFLFGFYLGRYAPELKALGIRFRSPEEHPDAILINQETGEMMNVDFESLSSNFREGGRDPAKCDLLVCILHDWRECPVPVLELSTGKLHRPVEAGGR